jgi:cell division protein FtsN
MNEPDTEQQPDALDEDALRRRLINRIALAGVAIVALLGGLAVIDTMYVAPPIALPKTATLGSVAELPKPVDSVSLSSVAALEKTEPIPEPPTPEAVPSIKTIAEPEESSSPSAPLSRPLPTPAQSLPGKQAATVATVTPAPALIPLPLMQGASPERRFVLQMGVFNSVDNAQELLAKLQKNGVPAQIEARVQVGPFKTKAEADATRSKLKAMGLDAGLLMTTRK